MARVTAMQAYNKTQKKRNGSGTRPNHAMQTFLPARVRDPTGRVNYIPSASRPANLDPPPQSSVLDRYKRISPESIAFASSKRVRWPRSGIMPFSQAAKDQGAKAAARAAAKAAAAPQIAALIRGSSPPQHKITEYFKVVPKNQANFGSSLSSPKHKVSAPTEPTIKVKAPLRTSTNTISSTENSKIFLFPGVYLLDKKEPFDDSGKPLTDCKDNASSPKNQNVTIDLEDSIELADQFRTNYKAYGLVCEGSGSQSSMEMQLSQISQKQTMSQISTRPAHSQSSLSSDQSHQTRDVEDDVEILEMLPPIRLRDHPVHNID